MDSLFGFLILILFFILKAVLQKKPPKKVLKEPLIPSAAPKSKPRPSLLSNETFIASKTPSNFVFQETKTPKKKKLKVADLISDRASLRKAFLLSEIFKRIDER